MITKDRKKELLIDLYNTMQEVMLIKVENEEFELAATYRDVASKLKCDLELDNI